MHLAQGLTSLNTKKRKPKKRTPDAYYVDGWRKQNKFYKQRNLSTMTLEEYIDYVHGVYKPKVEPRAVQTPWHHTESVYRRETPNVPSSNTKHGVGTATNVASGLNAIKSSMVLVLLCLGSTMNFCTSFVNP